MIEWLTVGAVPVFVVCCAIVCLEMEALAFATPWLRVRRNVSTTTNYLYSSRIRHLYFAQATRHLHFGSTAPRVKA